MNRADDVYMRDSDAFAWNLEADPLLRSTVVSVLVFDRALDLERLYDRLERATRMAPGFRHCVVQAPLHLGNPRWVLDHDFDPRFHVRRIAAPAPGTVASVLEYACQTGMTAFDRDRPLWELTLVGGVEGGRTAAILKMHHSLTDGIGGMDMAKYLFDLEPEAADLGPLPEAPAADALSTWALARDAARFDAGRVARVAGGLLRATGPAIARTVRHPRRSIGAGVDLVRSVVRTVEPLTDTLSPVMQDRRRAWRYDTMTVSLDGLREAARRHDLTLNDAFLGALTGGLRRYHARHDAQVDELRVTMPISIRLPDDPVGGNRITLMRFKVPVGLADPVARMRVIHDTCLTARHEPAVPYTNAIAFGTNFMPRSALGAMLKHVDFLASNVPGIGVPMYLAGARVTEWYAFGPTLGAAFNATLVSYDGRCSVGLNVDTGAVPDPEVLRDCLREGFDEILAVATRG